MHIHKCINIHITYYFYIFLCFFRFHLRCHDAEFGSNFITQHGKQQLRLDLYVCRGCRKIGRMEYKNKCNPTALIPHIEYCITIDSLRSFVKIPKQRFSRRKRNDTDSKKIEIEMFETLSCIIGPKNAIRAMEEKYLYYFEKNYCVGDQLTKHLNIVTIKPSPPTFINLPNHSNNISLSIEPMTTQFSFQSDDLSNSSELS